MLEYLTTPHQNYDLLRSCAKFSPRRDAMIRAIDAFVALMQRQGITISGYFDAKLLHFTNLPEETQEACLRQFLAFCEICSVGEVEGVSFRDDARFLRFALKKMNISCEEDDLSFITDGDVVEIYDETFTQKFRNFRFLELSSYDLESLICYPWYILFERSQQFTDMIIEQLSRVLLEKKPLTSYIVPTHVLKERYAPQGRLFEISEKFACALTATNGEKLALTTLTAVPVVEHNDSHKVSYLSRP